MKGYPERIDSKFRFLLLAAQRAEQLLLGATPKVAVDGRKTTRVALKEIREDSVTWDYGPAPEPEPVVVAETPADSEPAVTAEAKG